MTCSLPHALVIALTLFASASRARADEPAPRQWEQLFFPFPLVGAPPQLEAQVQVFNNLFTGSHGLGLTPSVEVGLIALAHLGFVAVLPLQLGFRGEASGLGDVQLITQYLAAGSLVHDNMVSVGIETIVPTAMNGLGGGDVFVGPFAYAAQRFWHRLIFEVNVTGLLPVVSGTSARQITAMGFVSLLLTPTSFALPTYVQFEADSTTYLGGTTALPPGATHSPVETVFLAPEIFLGPFRSFISPGTRVAAGVFFNVVGDPVHAVTYSFTASFDLPNRFGY